MHRWLASLFFVAAAPAFAATVAQAAAAADWVDEARFVAGSMPPKLLAVLTEQIKQGGPEGAIGACREQAPQMAKAASEHTGWQVRRVSLRNRNPKAVPDAWERETLEAFDRRAAAGENPATLERAAIVDEGGQRTLRYMRALPTQELCLTCHGAADKLSPAVLTQLKTLYPDDRATGYAVGQIRGAMTIRKPAP